MLSIAAMASRQGTYYAKLARFYAPVRWMAWVCAALIAAGAVFIIAVIRNGMNLTDVSPYS